MVKATTINAGAAAAGNEQHHPSDNKSEQKLQAVLLADIFTSAFHPITLDPSPPSSFSTLTTPSAGCRPLVLCPLNNVPILLHSINYLQGNGIQELYIVCTSRSGNPDIIENYIRHCATASISTTTNKSSATNSIAWSARLTITVLRFIDCTNPGDALRELDRVNVIKSDPFILMQGDVVSNVDLQCAMVGHVERRTKDASAIMTILLQDVGGWGLDTASFDDYEDDGEEEKKDNRFNPHNSHHHHIPPLRSSTDDLLLALDTTHSNRILLWDDYSHRYNDKYASIPTIFFQENSSTITLTRNYHDVGIDICSPDILARFSDEFDYRELRSQFVSNCVAEEEAGLQVGRIYAHMLERGEYVGRPLGDMRRYHQVSMDLLRRWCYPLVPDNHHYHHHHHDNTNLVSSRDEVTTLAVENYVCERHFVYRDVGGMHHVGSGSSSSSISSSQGNKMSSHIGRTTQLLGSLLLGPNYTIGERCTLQRSVLGPNCTLKDDVTIMDSHLWGNCIIENGASLSGVIVCEGAIIRQGAILERGCVVGMGCIVGAGVRLKEFTRITCAAAEVEDDDDYWKSSSSGEDDAEEEDSADVDNEALAVNTTTASSDAISNHDVVGKDGIGRVYVPTPPDDYDSDDDDDETVQAAAMELMKSQSIGYDMTAIYRKWQKNQMNYDDDGFSLDDRGSDDDDDDYEDGDGYMGMENDMMNNENAAAGGSSAGDGNGVQITGRQKGIDVVKELRDICLEHETTSPIYNLRIELNSFKFSQNASYSDCCKGAMMAVMTKIVDESGGGGGESSSGLTPGKLVGSLKKMMEYWGPLFKSICIGSDEEKAIIHSLELMALGQVGGSKFVSVLGTEPAFRFVLQTLHDQEIINEDAIFDWALERKDESKDSPIGRLFWQKPNQDFLEWLEEDSGSDCDGEEDCDEDSD